ncbi:MAG: asparagine--tRNA ligase [Candidatus Westeberhardia cardiocondylae]|nr:asparagine--tRNA ligase [Candidatus Westeberhardia cardiocondylae]
MGLISPISNILKGCININTEVTVQGWIRTRRDSKIGISFLNIYDGSCLKCLQIIVNKNVENYNSDILRLTTGCSIKIIGKLINSLGKKQKYEIKAKYVKILGWIDNPSVYPISAKYHTMEYLREVPHLKPRTGLVGAITRLRHFLAQSIHNFMNKQGFFWVTTPLITSVDTEGSGKMFRVSTLDLNNLPVKSRGKINFNEDFFGKETFLTVSGQLTGESYACALSKIYTFGPTFRAEHSNTRRHLSEFWMVEPEMAFSTLEDIIILAEKMLKYIFHEILTNSYEEIKFFQKKIHRFEKYNYIKQLTSTDFVHIEYSEVINILKKNNKFFKNTISWGMDLSFEHECYLTEKYFGCPIVIKNYPKEIKAFYMRINEDSKTVAAMDILFPRIGEIIGGSQREERLEKLDKRMEEIGLNKKEYWWYRDLRRYGTVPHSGFGLGLERLMVYITGIKNIKDVVPFPRTFHNAHF